MIGADPSFYLRWKLGGWGANGLGLSSPRRWPSTSAASAAPTAIHAACEDYRAARVDRPRARPRVARRRAADRLRPARAVGRARRGARAVRSARALARAMRRRGRAAVPMPAGHFIPEELPDETRDELRAFFARSTGRRRAASTSIRPRGGSSSRASTRRDAPCSPGSTSSTSTSRCATSAWLLCGRAAAGASPVAMRHAAALVARLLFLGLALVGCATRGRRATRCCATTRSSATCASCSSSSARRSASTSSRATTRQRRSRAQQRSLVYQRAKGVLDKRPFGTQLDVYAAQLRVDQPLDRAGRHRRATTSASRSAGRTCAQPYSRQRVQHLGDELRRAVAPTRSARSTRARSAAASRTTPARARISRYHREHGGDLIWEIGTRLLRLPRRRRRASTRSASPQNAARAAGEDDRDQALAGRQARPRRRAAGRQGHARDRRRRAACRSGVDCVSPARHGASRRRSS